MMIPKRAQLLGAQSSVAVECGIRFLLAAILSGSGIFGGFAPFGLGVVAASGSGMQGLSALIGLLVGSLLFMDFSNALKYIAIGILIFAVSVAFGDTKLYRRTLFMPVICAACTTAVGFIYVAADSGGGAGIAYFILEIILSALCAACTKVVLDWDEKISARKRWGCVGAVCICVLIAVSAIPLTPEISLGRVLTVVLVLYFTYRFGSGTGAAMGIVGGLAMDTAAFSGVSVFYCASYGASAVLMGLCPKKSRPLATAMYALGSVAALLFSSDMAMLWSLAEAAIGCAIFLLLPAAAFDQRREAREEKVQAEEVETPHMKKRLLAAADAFRSLYEDLNRAPAPKNEENIAIVFDRAADRVCRKCAIRAICWEKEYISTYNALNDASGDLVARGKMMATDLPSHFSSRCIYLSDFLTAVNEEFSAMLVRRRYACQMEETRSKARLQYAGISELLTCAAREDEYAVTAFAVEELSYSVGAVAETKEGESVCGDAIASFQTDEGQLCLVLCDGMGSGEAARDESAMTVRLLQRFLKSGVAADTSLKTLNGAMSLRGEDSGGFTTVDLLTVNRADGSAVLYKYGAAPTYIRHGAGVRRITGSTLPAGLGDAGSRPEETRLYLADGDWVVMISDGVADVAQDEWLRKVMESWNGESAQALADKISAESRRNGEIKDDRSVMTLHVVQKCEEV